MMNRCSELTTNYSLDQTQTNDVSVIPRWVIDNADSIGGPLGYMCEKKKKADQNMGKRLNKIQMTQLSAFNRRKQPMPCSIFQLKPIYFEVRF